MAATTVLSPMGVAEGRAGARAPRRCDTGRRVGAGPARSNVPCPSPDGSAATPRSHSRCGAGHAHPVGSSHIPGCAGLLNPVDPTPSWCCIGGMTPLVSRRHIDLARTASAL
ncbi:putative leader peptide [Pseudonocardia pini]|uniref:putative leader peptide n=1 Tax=Pseudonocardia pini TaxID=2758030 RepID=UPI0035E45E99